jgi:tetratricopeptide (TPR) repeat protein
MASCHRKLKQFKEALTLYHQVKANTEAGPEAFLQIGYTHEEAGEKDKAIAAFQQTCKINPKSSQASEAHAHLQSAYKITITLGGAQEK